MTQSLRLVVKYPRICSAAKYLDFFEGNQPDKKPTGRIINAKQNVARLKSIYTVRQITLEVCTPVSSSFVLEINTEFL